MTAIEREYLVEGFRFAGKEWHPDQPKKMLALHGWLDNAASFDVIAPLLPDYHIIALDLPGQGLSDHRSAEGSYNIWDDLTDLARFIDHQGWQNCTLLGHSRGSIIALLLAVTQPKRISALIGLDAITPEPKAIDDAPAQLAKYVNGNLSLVNKRLSSYQSAEDALKARIQVSGMQEHSARMIVDRSLYQDGDVYRWTHDARLMLSSAFRLTAEHNQAFVNALSVPCLVLLAEDGLIKRFDLMGELADFSTIEYEVLSGSHHFHMEQQAPLLANRIHAFLKNESAVKGLQTALSD